MKRVIICGSTFCFVLLLLLSAQESHARYFWEKIVQPDWQTHFNDVDHASDYSTSAWAVGDRGIVAHTTDSGITWSAQTSGIANDLQGVHFFDSSNGWIVGDAGQILATSDGGDTWSSKASGVTVPLYGIYFVDLVDGWAVGEDGSIIYSANGGSSWSTQTSGMASTLYGVYFWDTSNGWAVGCGSTIVNTTDGGTSWSVQSSPVTGVDLRDVEFNSQTSGWIVGAAGKILRTTDGGTSWTEQTSGTDQYLYSVDFFDGGIGWIAGGQTYDPGILLRTTDNGSTWLSEVTNKQMLGVSFATSNDGIAVGRYAVIARSTSGGLSWSYVTDTAAALRGYAAQGDNAWACGSMGTVFGTTDLWATWVEQDTGVYNQLKDVTFPATSHGWGVGNCRYTHQDVTGEPSTVIHTTDGGSSWSSQTLGASMDVDENMYDVFMLDTSRGWICGEYGAVFGTTDSGSTWSLLNFGDTDSYDVNNTLFGIYFLDSSEGWACGKDGLMIHSTSGGSTWTAQTTDIDVDADLYDVFAFDSSDVCAVGEGSTVVKTADGGSTWNLVRGTPSSSGALYGLDFYDLQSGLAVGSEGRAYRGRNAGWCWEWQGTITSFDVYDVLMISDVGAWASAGWGEILKYTSVSDTPALAVIKGQGVGLSDLNVYQYWSPAIGDTTYWEAASRNPSPYYFARDLWFVPGGNDIVAAAPVDIDDDGYDEIAVIKDEGGDYNFYIYEALEYGDTTFWDALARNPSPIARDLWYIPSGNNTVAMAGVKSDPITGGYKDLIAIIKNEGGSQKLYYYNCPARGELVWAQAFVRNGLGPYAYDEWYVPQRNSIISIAGADPLGAGKDYLVTIENSLGDYNLYVWNAPPRVLSDPPGTYVTELTNRFLQAGFSSVDNPVGLGNPQAQDLWIIPQRNDIVGITALKADDSVGQYPGNYDVLGVMENYSHDKNFYLWRVPVNPESTYIEAQVRQLGVGGLGTPQGWDFWVIPEVPVGRTPWVLGLDYD